MMQGFQDVTFSWNGEDFTVPAERQLRMILQLEDAIRGDRREQAVEILLGRDCPPISMSRLALAYATALRFAGAKVTDDEVYLSLQGDLADGNAAAAVNLQAATVTMIAVISPPIGAVIRGSSEGSEQAKKEQAAG